VTPERWTQIEELFHRACESDSKDRGALLDEACRTDPELRREVQALLASEEKANDELHAAVREQLETVGFPLIGETISHYRIIDGLAGGGMGLVYRAEDVKLGRRVALKFLPEDSVKDSAARGRFEREARAASALNHPHICTIYEFEEYEGQPFIVMELLDGHTLRERLANASEQLQMNELLDLAIQITDGLDAAHQKGIIHRDIKTANIFLTNRGEAKILDFGLAKIADLDEHSHNPLGEEVDETVPPRESKSMPSLNSTLTHTGALLGTVSYMSPEQVRGEKLDSRTDLFSFGAVLYEMATGALPFPGDTAGAIFHAILERPPVPSVGLNPAISGELGQILSKCLKKDRELRYQSAAALLTDLNHLKRDTESKRHALPAETGVRTAVQEKRRNSRLVWGVAAGSVALVLLAFGWHWSSRPPAARHGALRERQLTRNSSENRTLGAAISPDGKYLAFTNTKGLHFSVIETGEMHDVMLPEKLQTRVWSVRWFPDNQKLLLGVNSETEGWEIWLASIFGGAPRRLHSHSSYSSEVSPQGSHIAFISGHGHEIWVMGPEGQSPKKVLASEKETFEAVTWSPSGNRLAFIKSSERENGGSIETVALEGGEPHAVLTDGRLSTEEGAPILWLSDGRLIFSMKEEPDEYSRNLWELMTDPQSGRVGGEKTKITDADGVSFLNLSSSVAKKQLVVVKTHNRDDVCVGELKEKGTRLDALRRIAPSDSKDFPAAWFPDGKSLVFDSNRSGKYQIYRQSPERDSAELLVQRPEDVEAGDFSPDGTWILYWAHPHSVTDAPTSTVKLMRMAVNSGSTEQIAEFPLLPFQDSELHCPRKGSSPCVVLRWEQGELIFYALDPLHGQGNAIGRTKLEAPSDLEWDLSPDGSLIAISADQLQGKMRLVDLRNGTERPLQLPQGWRIWSLSWDAEGKGVLVAAQTMSYFLARIDLDGKYHVLLDSGRNQWLSSPKPSPDGRYLAYSQQTFETNAWLLENF
jgi:serine/threonine protein kinase